MTQSTTDTSKWSTKALLLSLLLGAILAAMLLMTRPADASAIYTVDSTGNLPDADLNDNLCDTQSSPGATECTLRAAIQQSNHTPGADTINFNIPGSGVHTISPTFPLPNIFDTVTIDGYSQTGASPNTLAKGDDAKIMIALNGEHAGSSAIGLDISASNTVVRGLAISNFSDAGVSARLGSAIRITGNFIGTDASGTLDLGNGLGVKINRGTGFINVGGGSPAARNLISGNGGPGVFVFDSSGNKVLGNYIGTNKNGSGALGNEGTGVDIFDGSNNVVGNGTSGAANTIAFNTSDGVGIDDVSSDTTGNRVLSNSILSNGDLGIDLNFDGRTLNDSGDPDTGANKLQNFPVLSSAKTVSGQTTIKGTLNSTPDTPLKVQFFSNPSGNEGKTFIGQKSVTTDGSGNVSFIFKPARKVGLGQTITATATDPAGNTSEFSTPRKVVAS